MVPDGIFSKVGATWPVWVPWLAVVAVFVVVFALLWRWLVRREWHWRERWQAFKRRPRIAAWAHRWDRPLRFLRNRLTPGSYLGLHLTVGALVILLGVWLFVEIADELLDNATMVDIDHRVSNWMQRHGTPEVTGVAYFITDLGSVTFITVCSVLVAGVLAWWRDWYRLLAFGLAVAGGGLLNYLLKISFARARPVFEVPLVSLESYSFPSGHTMGSTIFYGALALSALLYARWPMRWRLVVVFAAALLVVLIGFTRIYLGAHFLSDVAAAGAIGVAWLMASHTGVEIFRLRAQERQRAAEGHPA